MRRALPLALLALAVTALPASAEASKLAVRSVSAPHSATAGMPVDVQAGIGRKGRTPPARVRFYLSANGKRDRSDVHLKGDARVGRGRRSGTTRVAARPQIPAGQALGAYHLLACVNDDCRAARGSLRVTATPIGTRELVEAAVAAHKITPQQGLVYRVFAAFGDRRLPAAYAGDDAVPEDTVMRDVLEEWPRLSRAQRAQMRPFLLPPPAKGSWYSRTAGASQSPRARAQATCDSNQFAEKEWSTIAQPGGHVRIWWPKANDSWVGPRARSLVAEVENTIWPRLRGVFGREPLPDGGQHCFHGIDDKLDIYMLRLNRKRATTEPYPGRYSATPTFIVMNAFDGLPTRWELAHEITHAFQFAYRTGASCSDYDNWDEAVANWGAGFAYPHDDDEHYYPWLMEQPDRSLADASYEGWVFPFALQHLYGAGTIKAIYDEREHRGALEAIDAGIPGGLKKAWPEFARLAWNQDPVWPTFRHWDGFEAVPLVNQKPIAAEQLDPGAAGQVEVDVPLGLKPLTRVYRRFKLGPGVTQITIEKPSYADLSVQALVHTRDGSWRTEDWFQRQPVWCPRDPKDRPDEIVLVMSNNSLTQPSSGNFPLRLLATNIGCSRYTGEASGTSTYSSGTDSVEESWKATGLVYERILADDIKVPRFLSISPPARSSGACPGTRMAAR
jgi:hypothetical protein